MAMRDDGIYAVVWTKAENENLETPFFNIALQLFDANGDTLGDAITVNDESYDPANSTQFSPSVAFDSQGNIAVCWIGTTPGGCDENNPVRISASLLKWEGGTSTPYAVSGQILVDNDYEIPPSIDSFLGNRAHPSVALNRSGDGRWIVAWNTSEASTFREDIYAQYFDHARPMGRKFRLNQLAATDNTGDMIRRLANSAQHTTAYASTGEAIGTWSKIVTDSSIGDPDDPDEIVYFTILPDGFEDYQQSLVEECCAADVNQDGNVNGLDIQLFLNIFLADWPQYALPCMGYSDFYHGPFCASDMNADRVLDFDDIPLFVEALLLSTGPCPQIRSDLADCNENEVPDANDIAEGTSQDCNNNFVPDECDIDDESSADVDEDGVPDECQLDCNGNDIPDAKDIAEETSADVNENGIPDECEFDCNGNDTPDDYDIAEAISPDCNENGIPDECEFDCNENGVPDDCDIDPSDPDGDEWVSPDCNENGLADECDLALPPGFGSLDCNDNDIPDECDIASETSCDANASDIPDECEIAAMLCEDIDEDECCDGESLMGGGGQSMMGGEGPCSELSEEQCWELFWEWSLAQCWGAGCELSGFEQYQALINKLDELDLPLDGLMH